MRAQLNETEVEHGRAMSAVEAQRDAGSAREAELSEKLRKARQAAERAACSGEDDVIAVEKVIRARHEKEVAGLEERACKAEERVRARQTVVVVVVMMTKYIGDWEGFGKVNFMPLLRLQSLVVI